MAENPQHPRTEDRGDAVVKPGQNASSRIHGPLGRSKKEPIADLLASGIIERVCTVLVGRSFITAYHFSRNHAALHVSRSWPRPTGTSGSLQLLASVGRFSDDDSIFRDAIKASWQADQVSYSVLVGLDGQRVCLPVSLGR